MRNMCRSGRGGLRFGLNGAGRGVRRRADAPVGKSAHERIRVWGIGPACVKLSNGHTCKRPRPGQNARNRSGLGHGAWVKQKPRSLRFGDLLVAPTGVDPVTFRFSVERSTN